MVNLRELTAGAWPRHRGWRFPLLAATKTLALGFTSCGEPYLDSVDAPTAQTRTATNLRGQNEDRLEAAPTSTHAEAEWAIDGAEKVVRYRGAAPSADRPALAVDPWNEQDVQTAAALAGFALTPATLERLREEPHAGRRASTIRLAAHLVRCDISASFDDGILLAQRAGPFDDQLMLADVDLRGANAGAFLAAFMEAAAPLLQREPECFVDMLRGSDGPHELLAQQVRERPHALHPDVLVKLLQRARRPGATAVMSGWLGLVADEALPRQAHLLGALERLALAESRLDVAHSHQGVLATCAARRRLRLLELMVEDLEAHVNGRDGGRVARTLEDWQVISAMLDSAADADETSALIAGALRLTRTQPGEVDGVVAVLAGQAYRLRAGLIDFANEFLVDLRRGGEFTLQEAAEVVEACARVPREDRPAAIVLWREQRQRSASMAEFRRMLRRHHDADGAPASAATEFDPILRGLHQETYRENALSPENKDAATRNTWLLERRHARRHLSERDAVRQVGAYIRQRQSAATNGRRDPDTGLAADRYDSALAALEGRPRGYDNVVDARWSGRRMATILAWVWQSILDLPEHADPSVLAADDLETQRENARWGVLVGLSRCFDEKGARLCPLGTAERLTFALSGYVEGIVLPEAVAVARDNGRCERVEAEALAFRGRVARRLGVALSEDNNDRVLEAATSLEISTWMREMAAVSRQLPEGDETYFVDNIRNVAEMFPAGEAYLQATPRWPTGLR